MAKKPTSKPSPGRSERRRREVRRSLPRPAIQLRAVLTQAPVVRTTITVFLFLVLGTVLVIWSGDHVRVEPGQTMTHTRLNRLTFELVDQAATDAKVTNARQSAPYIYTINDPALQRLGASIGGLPAAVAGLSSIEDVAPDLTAAFNLDDTAIEALQSRASQGEPTSQWRMWVGNLVDDELRRTPFMDDQTFQVFTTTPASSRALLKTDGGLQKPLQGDPISLTKIIDGSAAVELQRLVRRAGFPQSLNQSIVQRLSTDPVAILQLDQAKTDQLAEFAVQSVQPETIKHPKGEIIYRRGDVLSQSQFDAAATEAAQYRSEENKGRWTHRIGIIGMLAAISVFFGAFAAGAYPRVVQNSARLAALCGTMLAMLALSTLVTIESPKFLYLMTVGPILLITVITLLVYDHRLAFIVAAIQTVLTALALEQSIAWVVLVMAGSSTMLGMLPEVRHRNTLIRASAATAAVIAIGTVLLAMIELPDPMAAWRQVAFTTILATLGSLAVGFLVLGILPSVERIFDITTGMTLAELRDPRRPMLRQLQQLAPGTYNHSLQVANIAEAAADAIGGDSLLVYVGALYHDIGKINKPEYFVENQVSGMNRHDRLSPAMSLLIIIGHVKDGIELAREIALPKELVHFIETHHGTTLVEYFYHAAKKQAKEDEKKSADEISYRYPGPKPRTKEAAILMLADAVESASRTLAEPTPGRIESLVRELSHKRLIDGQFVECDLTFSNLRSIEDAIISRVCAIYHGRVSYPEDEPDVEDAPKVPADGHIGAELGEDVTDIGPADLKNE